MYLEHGQSPPQQLSWQQQMVQTQLRRQEQQIIQLRTMQARSLNDYVPPPVYHTINNPVVHSFNYTNPFPAAPHINAGVTSVPNNLTMLVNNANIQPAPALSNNNSIVLKITRSITSRIKYTGTCYQCFTDSNPS